MERTELVVKQGCFSWCLGHSQVHTGWEESLGFPSIFSFRWGGVGGCSLDASPELVILDQQSVGPCLDEQLIKLLINTLISTARASLPLSESSGCTRVTMHG